MKIETSRILAQDCLIPNDTWVTHINNNDLIIGPSGAGKTRNYVKPNLLQCALQGRESLVVADTKGSLIREAGPVLAAHGCKVINLDLTDLLNNTVGYNPLDYVRYDPVSKKYNEQDILTLCTCLIPIENLKDPFWDQSAQLYLSALIGYALETLPKEEHSLMSVCRLYQAMDDKNFVRLFQELEEENPASFAARTYRMVSGNEAADRTYASIKMILIKNLLPLSFDGPIHLYSLKERVDFRALGREQTAVFLTISDTDRAMDKIANVFYTQALHTLIESADKDYRPNSRLPVPVRFILDDFATNVVIPNFDGIISIIRSREVYVSLIIQSINQLYALYGDNRGKTIINNCDNCLYLGGQDIDTADFISVKANKPKDAILRMPLDDVWLFTRGQKPRQVRKYKLEEHPLYPELPEAGGIPAPAAPGAAPVPVQTPGAPSAPEPDLLPGSEIPADPEPIRLTQSQFQSLEGRKRLLLEKAERVEFLLSGRSRPVLPEMTDENGLYSEEKTQVLINRLLECARFYYQVRRQAELKVKDQACLRSFFYCALRLSASRPAWLPEIRGAFQDLLTCARRMYYPNRISLCYEELCNPARNNDFFSWMDECYERLTGLSITSRISNVDEQLAREAYWEDIAKLNNELGGLLAFDPDDVESCYPEDWDEQEEQWIEEEREREWARENQRRQDWARDFPEPQRFCQHYLLLRELYFDTRAQDTLPQTVEQALDALLQEWSDSYFLDDAVFSSAGKLLDDAAARLDKLLPAHPLS